MTSRSSPLFKATLCLLLIIVMIAAYLSSLIDGISLAILLFLGLYVFVYFTSLFLRRIRIARSKEDLIIAPAWLIASLLWALFTFLKHTTRYLPYAISFLLIGILSICLHSVHRRAEENSLRQK